MSKVKKFYGDFCGDLDHDFLYFMGAFDLDELSDGAWFAHLEEGAEAFRKLHKLGDDSNDLVHRYIEFIG